MTSFPAVELLGYCQLPLPGHQRSPVILHPSSSVRPPAPRTAAAEFLPSRHICPGRFLPSLLLGPVCGHFAGSAGHTSPKFLVALCAVLLPTPHHFPLVSLPRRRVRKGKTEHAHRHKKQRERQHNTTPQAAEEYVPLGDEWAEINPRPFSSSSAPATTGLEGIRRLRSRWRSRTRS